MGMMREYKEVRKLYDEIGKKLIGNFLDIAGDSRL
jgi:hypothetical protein